jgi:hypothetical protein
VTEQLDPRDVTYVQIRSREGHAEVSTQEVGARFLIGPGAAERIFDWLTEMVTGPGHVVLRGQWARLLAPMLRAAGHRAVLADLPNAPRVAIYCETDRFSLWSRSPSDPPSRKTNWTYANTAGGRQALREHLARSGPVREVQILDPYGHGRGLAADLAVDGWPTHLIPLIGSWRVYIEVTEAEYEAHASIARGMQSRRFARTEDGIAAALAWLDAVGEVELVEVSDRDDAGAEIAAALRAAGLPVERKRSVRGPLPDRPWGERFGRWRCQLELNGMGWLQLTLDDGESRIEMLGSYLGSPWVDTLDALRAVVQGEPEASFVWIDEPGAHRAWLRRSGPRTADLIIRFDGSDLYGGRMTPDTGHHVYRAGVVVRDLAAAVLDASTALLNATDPVDVDARWPKRLQPTTAIGQLSAALDGAPE